MAQPVIKWVEQGYENGYYILAYYVDGILQCYMKGYPDYRRECFWVYLHKIARYSDYKLPKCKYVVFRDVKKGIK